MTSFYIDLNDPSSKKPKIIRLLIYGAVVCICLIAISISIFHAFKAFFESLLLISAVYLALYVYFAWVTINSKLFVKADGNGIEFKFGIRVNSKKYFIWDAISKVRIGYAYLSFYKKSGKKRKIQLSWLPYSKVIEIKEMVIEVCMHKKIPFEKVDFIDYSIKKDKKENN